MKPEPLQLGQVLYPVQDTTLICVPSGKGSAVHQRITYSGPGEHIVATANDPIDLGHMTAIRTVRSITNVATGKQEVVVVRQDDLDVIAHEDSSGTKARKLALVPPDFVRFVSIGASSGPNTVAPRPGETVGSWTPWYTSGDAVLVIGYDPLARDKRQLALLIASGADFGVQFWDVDTGVKTGQVSIGNGVCGAPVVAELIRHGNATWLLVGTVEEIDKNLKNPFRAHSLKLHAVDWAHLSPQTGVRNNEALESKNVTTLVLATNIPGPVDPEGAVFKGRHCEINQERLYARPPARVQISATVARLRKGVADQQLVLAWASGATTWSVGGHPTDQPAAWSCHVAVIGGGPDGKVAILAGVDPDVGFGFAISGAPIFRAVAADLKQAGVDQVVVGYPAFFGSMSSSVALMMFSFDEAEEAAPALRMESRTVVAATAPAAPHGNGRWGEFYLYLAAGVFGGYKAVQIITTARDDRESTSHSIPVVCGFVPVHPERGFPEFKAPPTEQRNRFYNVYLPGGEPAHAQGCQVLANIDWDVAAEPGYSARSNALRFFALPSDLTGQSVLLGAPTFTQVNSALQILAIIQAPPFDEAISDDLPTVILNTAADHSTGYNVSTSSMWTVSDDTHFSAMLGAFSVSKAIHDSHSKGLDNIKDTTVSKSVHFQLHTSKHDFMMVHEIGFDVWRYPVLRSSEKSTVGVEVLVIYPKDRSPKMSLVPCFLPEYGYRPNTEPGMLLSYCEFLLNNKKKLGYEEKNLLFDGSGGITVVHEKGGSSETFDASKMNTETVGKNFSLLNSVADSGSVALQTELFDFLPASFGMNLVHTESYSNHRVETTHVSRNEHFSLSITSGSVKDDIYTFKIVPYIYNHATLGCLTVAWDVELTGDNWNPASTIEAKRRRFDDPDIRLIRAEPDSIDLFAQSRSRSISVVKNSDATVDIVINLFNNSVVAATDVVCEIYAGKPLLKKRDNAAAPGDPEVPAVATKQLAPPVALLAKQALGEVGAMGRIETRLKRQTLDDSGIVTVRVSSDNRPMNTFGHIYWNSNGPATLK